jgi:hypothetical protein
MNKQKEKLYRKENKRVLNHRSNDPGSEYRYERNSKAMNNFEGTHKSIKRTRGGYDYTPLYKFLLSKVGSNWDEVFAEAVSRIDKQEPIWHLVELDPGTPGVRGSDTTIVRLGESTMYSALTVNEDRILVKIDPSARPFPPSCKCCTHTFNGKVLPYIEEPKRTEIIEKLLNEEKKEKKN